MTEVEMQVPAAPQILPANEQVQWKKDFAQAHKRAQADHPGDAASQLQAALRDANRVLRVPECSTYEEAAALKDWQVIRRGESGGTLNVVTIDGRKYSFAVPAAAPASARASAGKPASEKQGKDKE